MISTYFNAATARFRPSLEHRITEELLFDMPAIKQGPAIILGATRATPFMAAEAYERGHREFVVIGGKPVGEEDFMYTRFLSPKLKEAGLAMPFDPEMRECEYARQILMEDFGIDEEAITIFGDDFSTNLQENMEVLQENGYADRPSAEFFALPALQRRIIGAARKVWKNDDEPRNDRIVIAAHGCYPTGVDWTNWTQDFASAFYAVSEAEKVLADNGKPSLYERKGYVVPVDIADEVYKVKNFVAANPQAQPQADMK